MIVTFLVLLFLFYILGVRLYKFWLSSIYGSGYVSQKKVSGVAWIISFTLTILTIVFWYVIDIIAVIVALVLIKKKPEMKVGILIILVILLSVITITGISLSKQDSSDKQSTVAIYDMESSHNSRCEELV